MDATAGEKKYWRKKVIQATIFASSALAESELKS